MNQILNTNSKAFACKNLLTQQMNALKITQLNSSNGAISRSLSENRNRREGKLGLGRFLAVLRKIARLFDEKQLKIAQIQLFCNRFSILGQAPRQLNLFFVFILTLMIPFLSQAEVTATVDRTQVVIGETFNLVIAVDENTSEEPDLSELEQNFRVLGNSRSSSTKIVNGNYSVEKNWRIALMSLGIGTHTIPAIKLGNQSTKPIQITTTNIDPNAKANGDIFIEIKADKSSAFVKEQIIVTVKLFYSLSLSEGVLSDPIASGAIVTQLGKGSNYRTTRDGKVYEVIERKYAFYAEKNGMLPMNPIIFNGRDNTSRRNFSLLSTGKPVRAISKSLSFDIKPIPQSSIGKDWIPATKVSISQEWTKPPYKAGEPITRTITLYVEGLSETQIPDIDLGDIEDIRVYPEQPLTQTEKTDQTLKSWKQVKLALIPIHAGSIRIPEYQLEWFNTRTNKVEYAKLPPVTLTVDAGDFALEIPNVKDILNADSANKNAVVSAANPNPKTVTEIKIVEKDRLLWKLASALFALLWLITLILYLRKIKATKSKGKKPKPKSINKGGIIGSIKQQELGSLQSALIDWWNQQYVQMNVTNLSQIQKHVSKEMAELLQELETQLYHPKEGFKLSQPQWIKQVNGKGLKLVMLKNKEKIDALPNLY